MAKKQSEATTGFVFHTPNAGETCHTDAQNRIYVLVQEVDSDDFDYFEAVIDDIAAGGSPAAPVRLQERGMTGIHEGRVVVNGAAVPNQAPTTNNKRVIVLGVAFHPANNVTQEHRFIAVAGGSGSGSFESSPIGSAQYARLFRTGQPVPQEVQLTLDGEVTRGACDGCERLNQPTRLVYANDSGLVGCWLGKPMRLSSDNAPAAVWILCKLDATTWTLRLCRDKTDVVTYRATVPDRDGAFPVRLTLEKIGGEDCANWPSAAILHAV